MTLDQGIVRFDPEGPPGQGLEFGPYPVDEFMLVLDGSVNIMHEDGYEEIFRAGDAFVIPKGLPCQRKQTESIHKIYAILDDPDTPIPDDSAGSS